MPLRPTFRIPSPDLRGYHARTVEPAEFWDDLRFPATGLNPPGTVRDPSLDAELGLYTFADSQDNMVAGLAQMPHSWKEGSTIEPHVHWVQPSVGNVVWQLEYRLMPAVNGAFPSAWITVTSNTQVSTYPGSGDWVQITGFPSIDMTGYEISSMVLFRLSRLGSDVNDTVVGGVSLLEFDIHYQTDAAGSQEEFSK